MKNKLLILLLLGLVVGASSVLHACGKDTGSGVGGKVIITGSGSES